MPGSLTPQQSDNYFQDGFLWPLTILDEARATRHHEALLAAEAGHGPIHYRVKPYLLLESAWCIARSPVLLDAVEPVLGPDILLWDGAYIVKEPGSDGFISWHQDLTYWGLESESDDDLVTVWLALTPARRENGCMRFVRGSHRGCRYRHRDTFGEDNLLHRGQCIEGVFDERLVRHLEMAPGQASLHHGWAVHSSRPNRSDQRRVALSLQYVKPSVRQAVGQGETATLVRGQDRYGHFGAEPAFRGDFASELMAFQAEAERLKRKVYDNA